MSSDPAPNRGGSLTAFHRMEALVFSDTSDRFSEWPTDVGPKGVNFHSDLLGQASPYPARGGRTGAKRTAASAPAVRLLKHRLANVPPPPPDSPPPDGGEGSRKPRRRIARPGGRPPAEHDQGAVRSAPPPLEKESIDSSSDDSPSGDGMVPRAPLDIDSEVAVRPSVPARPGPEVADKLHLLGKAERLLNSVKHSLKSSAGKRPSDGVASHTPVETLRPAPAQNAHAAPSDDEIYRLLEDRYARPELPRQKNVHSSFHSGSAAPGGDLAGINWLLAGLPDVYSPDDENDFLDDEVVDRLLKEGGPQPSQLIFPSFYEHSQQKLGSLAKARKLRVVLTNLHVYSTRCGLRKAGSFVVITPPCGTVSAHSGGELARQFALNELEDGSMAAASRTNRKKHVNILHEYFVGSVELHDDKVATWDIMLTDEVVRMWITSYAGCSSASKRNGKALPSSSVRVEFFSLLRPRTDRRRAEGRGSDPHVRVGFLDIPLCGLLGASQSFDVVLSSEVSLDTDSNAVVSARLDRLPTGGGHSASKNLVTNGPGGPKMGAVSARVLLLTDKNTPLSISDPECSDEMSTPAMVNSRPLQIQAADNLGGCPLDDALAFVPEVPALLRAVTSSYVGIAVHNAAIDSASVSAILQESLGLANMPTVGTRLHVSVEYKVATQSSSIRNSVSSHVALRSNIAGSSSNSDAVNVEMYVMSFDSKSCAKVFEIADISSWRPLMFEVWVEWISNDMFAKTQKKLLGVARFSEVTVFRPHVRLPVRKLGEGSSLGVLDVSCHLHDSREDVEKDLYDSIALELSSDSISTSCNTERVPIPQNDAIILSDNDLDVSCVENEPNPRTEEPPEPIRPTASPVLDALLPQSDKSVERDEIEGTEGSVRMSVVSEVSDTELLGLQEYAASFPSNFEVAKTPPDNSDLLPLQRRRLAQTKSEENKTTDNTPANPSTGEIEAGGSVELHLDKANSDPNDLLPKDGGHKYFSHVLDISVSGTALDFGDRLHFDKETSVKDDFELLESMGFFIFYEFPSLLPADPESLGKTDLTPPGCENCFSIWWDKQCAILNGHKRHIVEISAPSESELKIENIIESLSARSLTGNQLVGRDVDSSYVSLLKTKLGLVSVSSPAITFMVVASDAEGGLAQGAACVATASLTGAELLTALVISGADNTLKIPLVPTAGYCYSESDDSTPQLELKMSGRLRPRIVSSNGQTVAEPAGEPGDASVRSSVASVRSSTDAMLPLLRRVEDFKWNKSVDFSGAEGGNKSTVEEGVEREMACAVTEDRLETALSDEETAKRSELGSLNLKLETVVHLTDLSTLCNPSKHSWKNYVASPLLYFVGTLYLAEHCFSCNTAKESCTCASSDDTEGPLVEWASCEVFRTDAVSLADIISQNSPLQASTADGQLHRDALDMQSIGDITVKIPDVNSCAENFRSVLRRATLRVSIHIRYDWMLSSGTDCATSNSRDVSVVSGRVDGTIPMADTVLGSVAVDLHPLAVFRAHETSDRDDEAGSIDGWYHIIDNAQRHHGQLKLSITAGCRDSWAVQNRRPVLGPSAIPQTDMEFEEEIDVSVLRQKLDDALAMMDTNSKALADNGYLFNSFDNQFEELSEGFAVPEATHDDNSGDEESFSVGPVDVPVPSLNSSFQNRTFVTEIDTDAASNDEEAALSDISGAENDLDRSKLSIIAGTLEEDDESWEEFVSPDHEYWVLEEKINEAPTRTAGNAAEPAESDSVETAPLVSQTNGSGPDFNNVSTDFVAESKNADGDSDVSLSDKSQREVSLPVLAEYLAGHKHEPSYDEKSSRDSYDHSEEKKPAFERDSACGFVEDVTDEKECYSWLADGKEHDSVDRADDIKGMCENETKSSVSSNDGDMYIDSLAMEEAEVSYGSRCSPAGSETPEDMFEEASGIDCESGLDLVAEVPAADADNSEGIDESRRSFDQWADEQPTQLSGDSPGTSNIKRLIDAELSNAIFVKYDAAHQPAQRVEQKSAPVEHDAVVAEASPAPCPAEDVVARFEAVCECPVAVQTPAPVKPALPIDVAKLVRSVMSKHEEGALKGRRQAPGVGSVADPASSPYSDSTLTSFPGRRRQFVETETSRISKIMLGSAASR